MVIWLGGELEELRHEMEEMSKVLEDDGETSTGEGQCEAINLRKGLCRNALVSEMGDVLFDALMLEMILRR